MLKYAIGETSLGYVLVAANDAGLCAVTLGDDAQTLKDNVLAKFPEARPASSSDAKFTRLADRVFRFVEAPRQNLDLPLDPRGTAFQQKVWRALRGVPAGATTSYAEIAKTIGAPKASRAVAGACAANPIAVAIPCHRVLRADGSLSGYRWGVERKRALLAREGAAPAA